MGPHPVGYGNRRAGSAAPRGSRSFNGAAPRRVRKRCTAGRPSQGPPCFNGAAPRRVRKPRAPMHALIYSPEASMGPHPVGYGNGASESHGARGDVASMGPHPVGYGNDSAAQPSGRRAGSFNGAAPRRVRKRRGAEPRRRGADCFNGAAPRRVRKHGLDCWGLCMAYASMGPHPVGYGNPACPHRCRNRPACFNGAAPRRVRKRAKLLDYRASLAPLQWGRTP